MENSHRTDNLRHYKANFKLKLSCMHSFNSGLLSWVHLLFCSVLLITIIPPKLLILAQKRQQKRKKLNQKIRKYELTFISSIEKRAIPP